MSRLSTFIASLPASRAFLLICIPFFGTGFLAMPVPGQPGNVAEMEMIVSRMMLTLMPVAIVLYSWIWSIGNVSNRAASENARRPDRFFNFTLPYIFVYLVFAYFFFLRVVNMDDPFVPNWLIGLVMILHFFAVVCAFYAIASAAMRLKSYETGNRVGLSAASATFFLIWFFPLGVWFVQPRINRASAEIASVS